MLHKFDAILFHAALCYYNIIWCFTIFIFDFLIFLFYQGFLSRTLTTHRTTGQRRGPYFIPLYHFHPLTNIQKRIWSLSAPICTWDSYHIFLIATFVFTRLLLDGIYHLIELLFDWLMMWYRFLFTCLLNWYYLGFVTAIWLEKRVNSNSHRLSSLYYKHYCCTIAALLYYCTIVALF